MDPSKTPKPKHKRFDSEEPAAGEFDQVVEEETKVEEEDESSDDDAPEVVAKHDAQERATVTARSTAKAVKE
jgi:U3 small nucleolar RNA-associated protein 16